MNERDWMPTDLKGVIGIKIEEYKRLKVDSERLDWMFRNCNIENQECNEFGIPISSLLNDRKEVDAAMKIQRNRSVQEREEQNHELKEHSQGREEVKHAKT